MSEETRRHHLGRPPGDVTDTIPPRQDLEHFFLFDEFDESSAASNTQPQNYDRNPQVFTPQIPLRLQTNPTRRYREKLTE